MHVFGYIHSNKGFQRNSFRPFVASRQGMNSEPDRPNVSMWTLSSDTDVMTEEEEEEAEDPNSPEASNPDDATDLSTLMCQNHEASHKMA